MTTASAPAASAPAASAASASTGASTHEYVDDPRNDRVLISINGRLVPRPEATVSVFDSGFILGDGVWEGLRLADGGIPFLAQHLERLYEGARAIYMDISLTPEAMRGRIFDCLAANAMHDGVHIRLMVTRGVKRTPYQDPRVTIGPPTVVIIPEYKLAKPEIARRGLRLFTVHVRRTGPDQQDQKLNSHSKLNCILACIQAAQAGADEALMLDPRGHVATCNSTHFFIVRRGELWTSGGMYCLGGITRGNVLRAAREAGIPAFERDFSLVDVYGADEAFVTGTFAGLTPVVEVDGRRLGHPTQPSAPHADGGAAGPLTRRLVDLYKALAKREAVPMGPRP